MLKCGRVSGEAPKIKDERGAWANPVEGVGVTKKRNQKSRARQMVDLEEAQLNSTICGWGHLDWR